jgi:hypothetical protein
MSNKKEQKPPSPPKPPTNRVVKNSEPKSKPKTTIKKK